MNYKIIIFLYAFGTSMLHAFEQLNSIKELHRKITQNHAVIVKIYRDDCPPCRQLAPVLAKFAQNNPSYQYFEVNSSKAYDIIQYYSISKAPTILYFFNGQLKGQDIGFQSYKALEKRAAALFQ